MSEEFIDFLRLLLTTVWACVVGSLIVFAFCLAVDWLIKQV